MANQLVLVNAPTLETDLASFYTDDYPSYYAGVYYTFAGNSGNMYITDDSGSNGVFEV